MESALIKKFNLPIIPNCKTFINGFTPEQIIVNKCEARELITDSERLVLKEAIEFYKTAFSSLKEIDLSNLTLTEAAEIKTYLTQIFNFNIIIQRDYNFQVVYRATIIKNEYLDKGKVRNPNFLSHPPVKKVFESKCYNRCSTFEKTLFYASFYPNVAVMEIKPKKSERIIISTWENLDLNKSFVFSEIPNANVDNLHILESNKAYNTNLEHKDSLYIELVNLNTSFIASEFVKDITILKGVRNPYRLEYLFSAFIGDRLLSAPPGPSLTSNDLIMYPSVPWKHLHDNIAMLPETLNRFKLTKIIEHEVIETFYDKDDLKLDEMPANLRKIREATWIDKDQIIWEEDE